MATSISIPVMAIVLVGALASAQSTKLSGSIPVTGDVRPFVQLTPGGERVVYGADAGSDEVLELFSAPLDASAPPVKLNGALASGGDVGRSARGV